VVKPRSGADMICACTLTAKPSLLSAPGMHLQFSRQGLPATGNTLHVVTRTQSRWYRYRSAV
jgi:hypothetical protein